MTLHFHRLDELDTVAHQLLAEGRKYSVWLFEGEMGAGKTTLIKALCRALGVVSMVQSPTFSIVNEYTTHEGRSVYHFDCYRLRNEAEALDIGIEEYFDSGDYCFIEWPERIESLWPATYYQIHLSADHVGRRTVETLSVD
ncbi:tRNA (adenosine(37)-N6)-threonylcarbamoyltransferase complex ATPase subunit type 1 TsaE [Spirosoma aureum]|jgi:tRNA threonylcarbamoyladenosine biosynthesis protein TsaE|uniref:tRNA threonylcarbamoyladenosine biosynthesis protein TsaE n=1 Tax=Spirosoma aureum TaxID=2692134 RepID=A0A6G9AJ82_9BACT|nr:tRNA (adenosine(37)-N6)-threonylcarbamoyltransferase complex ATPase subunit type 1 TsaE [Spirosoma aureum]QIP12379.1 tRNA (adenosine(37)-N6)-threonylcarbamoyltransferase complex ATPase subunit type 1 TsaE [Spirosoma aureum]